MKNSNNTNGNRTRDLSVCSAVSQPTAPPRAPRFLRRCMKIIRCNKLTNLLDLIYIAYVQFLHRSKENTPDIDKSKVTSRHSLCEYWSGAYYFQKYLVLMNFSLSAPQNGSSQAANTHTLNLNIPCIYIKLLSLILPTKCTVVHLYGNMSEITPLIFIHN